MGFKTFFIMKKYFIILTAVILLAQNASAQKNSIEVGAGVYNLYHTLDPYDSKLMYDNIESMFYLNIKYQRQINDRLGIYGQYTPRLPLNGGGNLASVRSFTQESVGKITDYMDYSYFDAGAAYRLLAYRKHTVSGFGALSMGYGKDQYLTAFSEPDPPTTTWEEAWPTVEYKEKRATYWGGVLGLRYDYAFWKNKMTVGANFAARYYLAGFPFQINYGVQVGCRF
jgi:hypothetical protein